MIGFFKQTLKKNIKQRQINPCVVHSFLLFQRNNMGYLCICSMQVHQSRISLSVFRSSSQCTLSGLILGSPRALRRYVPPSAPLLPLPC